MSVKDLKDQCVQGFFFSVLLCSFTGRFFLIEYYSRAPGFRILTNGVYYFFVVKCLPPIDEGRSAANMSRSKYVPIIIFGGGCRAGSVTPVAH